MTTIQTWGFYKKKNKKKIKKKKKKTCFGFIEKAQKSAPKVRFFECASLLRRKVQDHWGFKLRA